MSTVVRAWEPGDRCWIVPTWVRSFADYAPWGRRRTLQEHWHVVDRILDSASTRVSVLCSASGPTMLHAWCAWDEPSGALHYVYVPPELRGAGLARRVISSALGSYPPVLSATHPWPSSPKQRTSRRFRWDPYPLLALGRELATAAA